MWINGIKKKSRKMERYRLMKNIENKNWWNEPYDSSNKKDKLLVWLIALTWGGIIPLGIILGIVYFHVGLK